MSGMDSITTDAGVSANFQEISKDSFIQNTVAIREIHVDDLFHLEKDLDFHEKVFYFQFYLQIVSNHLFISMFANKCCQLKILSIGSYQQVSLMFLLCADDRRQYKIILQQLIVLSFDQTKETDLLRTWAKAKVHWKNHLLEALCIIQAKSIIRKLGLIYTDLEQHFLPANHYTSSHIHLIVKVLYFVGEQLTIRQCKKLIDFMTQKYPSIRNFEYSDNGEHLEIHLMNWLWENIIDIGQIDNE